MTYERKNTICFVSPAIGDLIIFLFEFIQVDLPHLRVILQIYPGYSCHWKLSCSYQWNLGCSWNQYSDARTSSNFKDSLVCPNSPSTLGGYKFCWRITGAMRVRGGSWAMSTLSAICWWEIYTGAQLSCRHEAVGCAPSVAAVHVTWNLLHTTRSEILVLMLIW